MNHDSTIQFATSPSRRKLLIGGAAVAAALSLSGPALGATNSSKQLAGGVTMQSIQFKNNDIRMAGNIYLPKGFGRVEMWRGGGRFGLSVAAPFVWRCPSNLAVAPFPHPAHRTGHADLPHPALGQDFTLSPTSGCVPAKSAVRARVGRRGSRVDSPRLVVGAS
jgi:hypothetical protein